MRVEPSSGSGSCPRCGASSEAAFKYCPACAYRLRPGSLGNRLAVLAGYLAFVGVLALAFYGVSQLGTSETETAAPPQASRRTAERDATALELTRAGSFAAVDAGYTFWGLYDAEAEEAAAEVHYVDDAFELCVHEITNDQYYEFLSARAGVTGEPVPEWLYPGGWADSDGTEEVRRIYMVDTGDLPVVGVPFAAALEFCGWFWQEKLGADPNVVVDLPSWLEYVRAARGDSLEDAFPWGRGLRGDAVQVNLNRNEPLPVNDERVGKYRGFFALVGNVAEWVHWDDEWTTPAVAAGWSHRDAGVYKEPDDITPFSLDGFRIVQSAQDSANVGFRIVIRRAPALPGFAQVEAGTVRHVSPPKGLLPPDRGGLDPVDEPAPVFKEDIDPVHEGVFVSPRETVVTFRQKTRIVARDFEIARREVTNRQYLFFLAAIAPTSTTEELQKLVPRTWQRRNLLSEKAVFRGCFLDSAKLERRYTPGHENRPVQGVTFVQATAYCDWVSRKLREDCRIPTVGEYLRAGRSDGTQPYPWGSDELHTSLVCTGRADSRGRSVSAPSAHLSDLVGNLAEFVVDELNGNRVLLAGGCYELPAFLCTLDSFLDASWAYVEYQDSSSDVEPEESWRSPTILIGYHTGFRIVKASRGGHVGGGG